MKFDKNLFGKDWIPYTVAACSAVVLYLLLSHLGGIWNGVKVVFGFISPVFGAVIIAYVVDALVMFFVRTVFKKISNAKRRRIFAIVLAILTILALLTLMNTSTPTVQ